MTIPDGVAIVGCSVLIWNTIQSYRNGLKATHIASELKTIVAQTNGMSAHLVKLTGETEFAKGLKQGQGT